MDNLQEMIGVVRGLGYDNEADIRARVCQDIVLEAISKSALSRNVTIKGGVVMRSVTGDIRRATQDMDIDFIRYPLTDGFINRFVNTLNCIDGILFKRVGAIEELSQQDYRGKRVFIKISDRYGNSIDSKIDLGVHNHLDIEQEEYCFDIAFSDEGASLLINSKEQMFSEKLRSLLKFGSFSTRYKDVYDMYYHSGNMNKGLLIQCFGTYIFNDTNMRENNMDDIVKRISAVFSDRRFINRLDTSDKRWLDDDIGLVTGTILDFLKSM